MVFIFFGSLKAKDKKPGRGHGFQDRAGIVPIRAQLNSLQAEPATGIT